MTTSILFVCKDNAVLGPIAEALLNQMGKGEFEASSAGLCPSALHPLVPVVLAERQIEASSHHPQPVSNFKGRVFDYVITLSEPEQSLEFDLLPARVGKYTWTFPDPAQTPGSAVEGLFAFRRTVIELSMRLSLLLIIARRQKAGAEVLLAA